MSARQRRITIVMAVTAVVFGLVDVAIVLASSHAPASGLFAALTLFVGWSFVGAGLFAWAQRPESRVGLLLALVGLTWFINPLFFSDSSGIFVIGALFGAVPLAVLGHLMLAFPDGLLHERSERRVVALGYLTATVFVIPTMLFLDSTKNDLCKDCPANPILIHANDSLARLTQLVVNVIALCVIVAIVVLMRRRWKGSSKPQRRSLGPVLVAGSLTLIGYGVLFAAQAATGQGADQDNTARVMFVIALVIFGSVPFAFLTGIMRMRLSRASGVTQLVDWLATRRGQYETLRDLLAEALDAPDLDVAYWLPERERWVDSRGRPTELPAEGSKRAQTKIDAGGQPIAVIVTDAELVEERLLLQAVGPALALSMENERLAAALRARVEELRASRARIVRAGDEERRRLERDLHDGAQQRLVALALNLKLARESINSDPAAATGLIDDAVGELTAATAELRELARGIHPAVLTDRGLEAAVTALAARAPVPVELLALPDERLAAPVESTAYFVVAESLTNVSRYSQASHAEVEIRRDNGRLVVEVRDDGVGGADPKRGSGLRGLADRVGSVDGTIAVESPSGRGTTVRVEIPCEQ